MTAETMKIAIGAVYLTDNRRALCGEHLGATARTTGRDLSGRLIYRVTPWDVEEAGPIACEICGRQAPAPFTASAAEYVEADLGSIDPDYDARRGGQPPRGPFFLVGPAGAG